MRLISCYIENFGGLSQYRLDFQEGLTVVLEDNGFGKTTLAEFIRAMFYGFPRSGKGLDKNPRKKYAPWNGGAWGGNLIFEHQEKLYRIDRRFGATPKGDTFELTDERTHKHSSDFTANIGVELFGLDADSFARSTYMPQSHDHATVATTGIQSKLGDLVHDTNDINNYDNAIKALKEKRSGYIPFRGKGGSVAEAVRRITELQEQLDLAEDRRPELERVLTQLEEVTAAKAEKTCNRDAVRTQIRERAQYDAKASAEKQLLSLETRKGKLEQQLRSLLEQYPKGLPSMNELKRTEYLLGRLPLLAPQSQTQTDLDAQRTLDQLDPRFASGIPEEPFFSDLRKLDRALIEGESALSSTVLTDQELTHLAQLETFFAPGIPESEHLSQCQAAIRELTSLENRLEQLSPERLRAFFADGVPEEPELDAVQEQLNRLTALRQENLQISSAAETQLRNASVPKATGGNPLLLMLLGVTLACLGITGVFLEYLVPGMITLVLGILLLAAGFARKLKQEVARELRAAVPTAAVMTEADRQQLRENALRIDALELQITAFTARFPTDALPLPEKLSAIRSNRERYLELQQLCSRRETLTGELTTFLSPYFGTGDNFDEQLPLLQLRAEQFRDLSRKRELYDVRAARLREDCAGLREQLEAALSPYFPQGTPGGYTAAIARLEGESRQYAAARSHLSEQRRLGEARAAELEHCREELEDFNRKYAPMEALSDLEHLHRLRYDVQNYPRLRQELRQAAQELRAFRQDHAQLLTLPLREDLPDPETLKRREEDLTGALQRLEQELVVLEQRRRTLYIQIDAIPQMRDELEQWQEHRLRDIQNCTLLDQTVRFLEQAREALSTRYMGTVQQRFLGYMNRLYGAVRDDIFVTAELEVTVERFGEPRPLEHFSAGQTDIVALCMRLALVDALFQDTRPLLILDDPFVNLDERNLSQALAVLKELSRDHQILYLVCNSSRMPRNDGALPPSSRRIRSGAIQADGNLRA